MGREKEWQGRAIKAGCYYSECGRTEGREEACVGGRGLKREVEMGEGDR